MENLYPISLTKQIGDIMVAGKTIDWWIAQGVAVPHFEYSFELISWFNDHVAELVSSRLSEFNLHEAAMKGAGALGEGVKISDYVVLDTSNGPIIIDDHAHIEPFSYLVGPLYIGRHVEIKSHSRIGPCVSLGDYCKAGGEVAYSLFQNYSNKAHDGFIGHSYVGSWVNIGAGSAVSNLKSTYGTIKVQAGEQKIDTNMQFLGTSIGDFAKLAVHTTIRGGVCIGVNSYVSGLISKHVPSFVMMTESGDKVVDIHSALLTQQRMFLRRNVSQTEADKDLLKKVFAKRATK